MTSNKKPLFTLASFNESIPEKKQLTDKDSVLDYPDQKDEIIALRFEALKQRHSKYQKYVLEDVFKDIDAFQFIYREAFNEPDLETLKNQQDLECERINQILSSRIAELSQSNPDLKLDLNDLNALPNTIKEYLFSPPLILTQDNAIMLWDD